MNDINISCTPVTIEASDGFSLSANIYEPTNTPKGFIQFNSGTGIPKEFYRGFAAHCAKQGFVTVTYDYRGIGGSAPESLRGFEATNVEWGTLDASSIFDWSMKQYPDLRKTVIGHSMGGQIIGMMHNATHIDNIIMIASGTGYWKDMPEGKLKSMMPFIWFLYIPVTVRIFGYANAKKIRQGENLPKGVVLNWRKWCISENYWEDDFGKSIDPDGFYKLQVPIQSITFSDDSIISKTATKKLLSYYRSAPITHKDINPEEYGLKKLDHFGFFSKKSGKLWKEIVS